MKQLRFAVLTVALLAALATQAQEAVRPDVGKPLQAAQDLIKAGKYKEALAKVRDADAVGNKNANEAYLVERMRIAAASGAGDMEAASRAFEVLAAGGKLAAADKARMAESIAGGYYRAKDYTRAMQWGQRYFKEGGSNPAIRTLLIQSQYLAGDYAGAARELTAEIQAAEKGGTAPGQDRLNLLLNAVQAMAKSSGEKEIFVRTRVESDASKATWGTVSVIDTGPGIDPEVLQKIYQPYFTTKAGPDASDASV